MARQSETGVPVLCSRSIRIRHESNQRSDWKVAHGSPCRSTPSSKCRDRKRKSFITLDERNKEFVFIDGMADANMKVVAEQLAAGGTAAVFDVGA